MALISPTKGRTLPPVKTSKLEKAAQWFLNVPEDPEVRYRRFHERMTSDLYKIAKHYKKRHDEIGDMLKHISLTADSIEELKTLALLLRDVTPIIKGNAEFQLQALKDVYVLLQEADREVRDGCDLEFFKEQCEPGEDHYLLKFISRQRLSQELRRVINAANYLEQKLKQRGDGKGLAEPLDSALDVQEILEEVKRMIDTIRPVRHEMNMNHPLRKYLILAQPDYPSFMTLFLTVISSFFYMGNFYLLSIAAKDYATHLNMPASFSGLLTGLNWAAAVVFAFVYSFWSNYEFKLPTVVCAFIVTLGNLLYFIAWDCDAAILLFAGRLLIGVGGPRVINRRYIAVYVAVKARTRWNAFYVAGSILGMACGPFAAAALYYLNFTFFGLTVNGMNSPAFVMIIIWLIYGVLCMIYFVEPEIEKKKKPNGQPVQEEDDEEVTSWWPMIMALWALFFPKLVQESFIVAAPIVADTSFEWSVSKVGIYLAIISFIVAPVHGVIGWTSSFIEDRQFILFAKGICVVGAVMLIDFGGMPLEQYIIGSLILYFATNIADPVSTSLTSKVLPKKIAKGLFNAGLLATLAGSLGRAFGGVAVAVAGAASKEALENNLFVPLSILCLISVGVMALIYPQMVPIDQGASPQAARKSP